MNPSFQFIEPLEPRIAPAILVNGGNLLGGKGNPTTGQTSIGGNSVTLITVLKGEALVFFDAASPGVITGISVGPNTKLDINGDVSGDIVTNLMPNGQLSDSDHNPSNGENGGVLMPYNIVGITTHKLGPELGSIGRIIAGGSIKNVNVAGGLSGLYTGDGIFKSTTNGEVDVNTGGIDFNPITPGVQDIIRLHSGDAQSVAVPNITNVTVGIADHLQIFAGDGKGQYGAGLGNGGGNITDVTISTTAPSDLSTPAIFMHAGNGAKGASGRAGGVGGAITQFTDAASTSYVKVETGNGGADTGGTGGIGGSFTDSSISSSALLYEILVGNGGAGGTGGAGGSINTISFTDALAGQAPLIATGDFNGDGIPDVLLVNTVTGNATLSEGLSTPTNPNSTEAPFEVVLHPAAASVTSLIKPEGSVPSDLVAADLNGDGLLDFVVSYSSSDNLGIFINDGNGQFTASSVALPASPTRIAVGDFLANGHADIAVLTAGNVNKGSSTLSSQLYVVAGTGTGTFSTVSAPENFAGVASDLVSGQLDGAGGMDVAVGFKSGVVDTFLATDTATGVPFAEASSLAVFNGPVSNLDITNGALLAFAENSTGNEPGTATPVPVVQILGVTATGGLQLGLSFMPGLPEPTAAHFIGSVDTIGVVNANGVSIYTPAPENTYASVASVSPSIPGALSNFATSVVNGAFQLDAVGTSSSRFFSVSGDLGGISELTPLLPFDVPGEPFVTNIVSGAGGNGGAHAGGAGGSITGLTFAQSFGPGVEQAGARLNLTIATGAGGTSQLGTGGDGGAIQHVALSLNPADFVGLQDSTTLAVLSTGAGGKGAIGGAGGDISKVTSNSIFDQPTTDQTVIVNSVALQLLTGNGGQGTAGAGGNGGNIELSPQPALSGVSGFDIVSLTPFAPGLLVQSGNGGNGTSTGGDGGSLTNIQTQNAAAGDLLVKVNELNSASIISGSGGNGGSGDGGNGGAITNLNVAVQSQTFEVQINKNTFILDGGGTLSVTSGSGGLSKRAEGGAGGAITQSVVASVDGDGFRDDDDAYFGDGQAPGSLDPFYGVGVLVHGGAGGAGARGGGAGAGFSGLVVNSPSATDVYAAILLAGAGGQALHSGSGGAGGSIANVTEPQDVDSSLSLLQGGNGGAGIGGHGGAGGSVSHINTAGFIGLPATATSNLGVFNDSLDAPLISALGLGTNVPQGVFAGRGGVGGVAGSVIDVVANEIAAIGAAANAQGIFATAHTVDGITADLIGYEVVRNNHFNSTKPGDSPAHAQPIDGFILAKTVVDITTDNKQRTNKFTFHG
jgi:hypothetical protein